MNGAPGLFHSSSVISFPPSSNRPRVFFFDGVVRKSCDSQRRLRLPQRNQVPHEFHQIGIVLAQFPVDPAYWVVLAIGIVIALLRPGELVATKDHRHTARHQQRGQQVAHALQSGGISSGSLTGPSGPDTD